MKSRERLAEALVNGLIYTAFNVFVAIFEGQFQVSADGGLFKPGKEPATESEGGNGTAEKVQPGE